MSPEQEFGDELFTGTDSSTLVFCAVCAFLIYSAVLYKPRIAVLSCALLLLGLPIYWLTRRWPAEQSELDE